MVDSCSDVKSGNTAIHSHLPEGSQTPSFCSNKLKIWAPNVFMYLSSEKYFTDSATNSTSFLKNQKKEFYHLRNHHFLHALRYLVVWIFRSATSVKGKEAEVTSWRPRFSYFCIQIFETSTTIMITIQALCRAADFTPPLIVASLHKSRRS